MGRELIRKKGKRTRAEILKELKIVKYRIDEILKDACLDEVYYNRYDCSIGRFMTA